MKYNQPDSSKQYTPVPPKSKRKKGEYYTFNGKTKLWDGHKLRNYKRFRYTPPDRNKIYPTLPPISERVKGEYYVTEKGLYLWTKNKLYTWESYNKRNKITKKKYDIRRRHGIEEVEYMKMFEKQHFMCEINGCKTKISPYTQLTHIDHNHKTGNVRGILCHKCNIGLHYIEGYLNGEFVNDAQQYLKKYS